ncbi:MAG TPA: PD-(D/E)XK nuclease family protein [Burkholderiales bacterium]|nr:PD-(D/E)XK nuclease family protein [Burkholderiales bacterium]
MLGKSQLFARLEEGHGARITVVTPNRRLAHRLTLDFDDYQIARGLSSWEAADILPFGSWVERLWEDALYSDLGGSLPLLLTPAQEQHLWEGILAKHELLIRPQAAVQCREAWRLIHQWRVGTGQGNEDAMAFNQWAAAYKKQTAGEIDAARLPDLMLDHLSALKLPSLVVAYAFDVMPPQTREFLARFSTEECAPDPLNGTHVRAPFLSAKLELEAAAKWARARLEDGKKAIGVVVPDLGQRRAEVSRVFSRTMQPGYNVIPPQAGAPFPFNISLGKPLATYPLVAAALGLLELSDGSVEFALASFLIRSPFIGGADTELSRRATLDVRIRKDADETITLAKLIAASTETAPLLRKRLEMVFEVSRSRPTSPAEWARHFSSILDAAGFPGERTLDSDEFQARAKLHEVLGELAKLERISQHMSLDAALATLRRLCADTLFQPETPDAPIQILGVMEAQAQRFDCLWVAGLTDQVWPRDAAPNPFIPIALQKKAGIPQASAEASLAYDRRITEEWMHSAAEVVFSHPTKDEERNLAPSPLISDVPVKDIALPDYPRYRDLLFASRKLEQFQDVRAPAAKLGKQRGGTRVLADQAMCPFRAFARWRLGADEMEEPSPGLDARDRGKLLHALMREIWTRVRSHSNLANDLTTVIAQSAATAVKEMGLEGKFAELERERLAKLAREWLEVESRRAPFEVEHLEQQRELSVAGLKLDSRIDRMDRLAEGGHVLIDYKTGNVMNVRQWDGPRPEDPQVPLYAVAAPEDLAAVSFARLRPGAMKFIGYSKAGGILPEVSPPRNQWAAVLAQWKKDAEALGKAFVSGDARVDPKEELKTCRRCELHTLCRVYEKY